MEADQIKEMLITIGKTLETIPWWGYLIALIAYGIVFGKKKEWEYEASNAEMIALKSWP